MSEDSSPAPGLIASLRALADHAVAGAQERLELFSLELQEEKYRLIQTFVWICAAVFAAAMALAFVSLTVVFLFWESARLVVLGCFAVLYGAAFGLIVGGFRRYLARQPKPFVSSLQELKEDRTCIQTPS